MSEAEIFGVINDLQIEWFEQLEEMRLTIKQLMNAHLNHFQIDEQQQWNEQYRKINEQLNIILTQSKQY